MRTVHYRLVKGVGIGEEIIEKIDNCKGGHCITWYGSHDGTGVKVFRCIRCKKVFVLVQKNTQLEVELKKQYMIGHG